MTRVHYFRSKGGDGEKREGKVTHDENTIRSETPFPLFSIPPVNRNWDVR